MVDPPIAPIQQFTFCDPGPNEQSWGVRNGMGELEKCHSISFILLADLGTIQVTEFNGTMWRES